MCNCIFETLAWTCLQESTEIAETENEGPNEIQMINSRLDKSSSGDEIPERDVTYYLI